MQTTPTATIPRRGHLYTIGVMNSPSSLRGTRVERALALALETLDIEAAAIRGLKSRLGPEFLQVVSLVLGIRAASSSWAWARAATSDARSRHPGFHGYTGVLCPSGRRPATATWAWLPPSKTWYCCCPIRANQRNHHPVACTQTPGRTLVAVTGNSRSTLAHHADVWLDCGVEKEACPLNLAPTASTTAQLALGDALAVALLDARGFRAEDFARSHPGGALGRKLLTLVGDVMRAGADVPRVAPIHRFQRLCAR